MLEPRNRAGVKARGVPLCIAALGVLLGGAAGIGILHDRGVLPEWTEGLFRRWLMSSDELAERGFKSLLAGKSGEALGWLREALERDQASPYRWCDYGEALLAVGNPGQARRCMEAGVRLGPRVGPIRMRAVNFAYRTDDAKSALAHGLKLVGMTDAYDVQVFTVWDRMQVSAGDVLSAGIEDRRSAQSYLRHLMIADRVAEAGQTWNWTRLHNFADDALADEYATFLVRFGEREQAVRAWADYTGGTEEGYPQANAIFNGGFERQPSGTIFDWRLHDIEGARLNRDESVRLDGRWSLRVAFDHTSNPHFVHVFQRTFVTPGTWRFEGWVRTQEITTDEGVGFWIFDSESMERLSVRTEFLTGTHPWTRLMVDVPVGSATRSLDIRLTRSQSLRFDNLLGGTVWLDRVSLRRLGEMSRKRNPVSELR